MIGPFLSDPARSGRKTGMTASIHELFEGHAAKAPDALALMVDGATITYGELNRRANQVAHSLRRLGVKPEIAVGLSLARSADLVIGLLGILKAGGFYVPVDSAYPSERREFLRKDAGLEVVVTRASLGLDHGGATLVQLDEDAPRITLESSSNPRVDLSPDAAAYGIYTSGSTGSPKCVVVTHASLCHYSRALCSALAITAADRYLHTASFSFSASTRQLLVPLSLGACVVIAGVDHLREPLSLFALVKRWGVTIVDTVPSYLQECAAALGRRPASERAELLGSLRLVMTTGEPLPPRCVAALRSTGYRGPIVNLYGQTETAGSVALHEVSEEDVAAGVVPFGGAFGENILRVLDARMEPVPTGSVGELYVGGPSLARGYRGASAPREDRFVADPFSPVSGALLYRTGDMVRSRRDGALDFVGRADHQVKINGIRVNLDEVEAALAEAPGARQAAAVAREEGGTSRLVGYVVADPEHPLSSQDIRAHLKQRMPAHLVPSSIVLLDRLPRTPSGKIDRSALPRPLFTAAAGQDPNEPGGAEAPRSPLEALIVRLLAEIVGAEAVDAHADFFEMGGDSLQAVQFVTQLQEALPMSLPLTAIFFQDPTIAGISEGIEAEVSPEGAAAIIEHLRSTASRAGAT